MDVKRPRRKGDAHEARYSAKQSRLATLQGIDNDRSRLVVEGVQGNR